jgi:hypothetical protein
VNERTRLHETSRVRLREKTSRDQESIVRGFESRPFERSRVDGSRVREFERSSSTVVYYRR